MDKLSIPVEDNDVIRKAELSSGGLSNDPKFIPSNIYIDITNGSVAPNYGFVVLNAYYAGDRYCILSNGILSTKNGWASSLYLNKSLYILVAPNDIINVTSAIINGSYTFSITSLRFYYAIGYENE